MKTYLSLVFATMISLSAFSQKGIEIGFDVMPQTHWIMNKSDFDLGNQLDHVPTFNLAFGVHFGVNFSNTLGLHTGLLYSSQGQNYEDKRGLTTVDYAQELTYLKIPLLLKFNSNPDNGAYFIGMVGPQLGLLTKVEQTGDVPSSVSFPTVKDAYKSADIGGVVGFGLGINLSEDIKLGILFRFDGSLGDIENKDDSVWNLNRENSSNVTGGVMFSLNYIIN